MCVHREKLGVYQQYIDVKLINQAESLGQVKAKSKQKVRALEVTMQISGDKEPESLLVRKETRSEVRDQIMSEID